MMSGANLKEKLNSIGVDVEPVIKSLLTSGVETKNVEFVYHQIKSGGKRIRPALVVICGQLFGGDSKELLYPAAAVEIMHNATLIIDDIIDHSEFRRDKPTTWNMYGKSIAECASLVYMVSIFSGLAHVNNGPRLVDLYSNTLKEVIDGEVKDILFERSGREEEKFIVENRYQDIELDDYLTMIGQKTAVLLRASCEAGAICAGADDNQVKLIGEYGFNIGMAFQIRDDILDIFGDEKEFGKKIGKDIIEKKMGNIVILYAIQQLSEKDSKKVLDILNSTGDVSDQDVALVKGLIEKTDAKHYTETIAEEFVATAVAALQKLPDCDDRSTLNELALYIIDRDK
jgi:geranylgeranyl diphosphate synthase type I